MCIWAGKKASTSIQSERARDEYEGTREPPFSEF